MLSKDLYIRPDEGRLERGLGPETRGPLLPLFFPTRENQSWESGVQYLVLSDEADRFDSVKAGMVGRQAFVYVCRASTMNVVEVEKSARVERGVGAGTEFVD